MTVWKKGEPAEENHEQEMIRGEATSGKELQASFVLRVRVWKSCETWMDLCTGAF